MTTRERLHAVVDRLDDEQAGKALEYIDGLVFGVETKHRCRLMARESVRLRRR